MSSSRHTRWIAAAIITLAAAAFLITPVLVTPDTAPQAAASSGVNEDCGNVTCTVVFSRSATKQFVAPAGVVAAAASWVGVLGKLVGPVAGVVATSAGRAVMIGRCLKIRVASVKWVIVGPVVGIGTDNGPRCTD